MKLIVAVVRDEFALGLTENLTKKGFGATKLASTGGFLKAGNTTFLIGVPQGQLDEAIDVIRTVCRSTKKIQGDLTFAEGALKSAAANPSGQIPSAVNVGGATVFVIDVEKMMKV
ncbi:MAG TPA: cyclic-di-AMP receptor [Symbiobacteriaceae bacterium]|nr:cyclic-di-AMP receptor [Symbiobacteriaceae bacterium]